MPTCKVNFTNGMFTLKRNEDEVFVGFVNVKDNLADVLAAIDRIQYIYVNGALWHQDQIAALSITGAALEQCS